LIRSSRTSGGLCAGRRVRPTVNQFQCFMLRSAHSSPGRCTQRLEHYRLLAARCSSCPWPSPAAAFKFSANSVPPSTGNSKKLLGITSKNGGHRQRAGVPGHGPIPVRGLRAFWTHDNVLERVAGQLRLHRQWFEIQVKRVENTIDCVFTSGIQITLYGSVRVCLTVYFY